MPTVFQIIRGDNIVTNVGTLDGVTALLVGAEPGRYIVEESSMAGELLPSGYSCQRWGIAMRQADGTVTLEPELTPTKRGFQRLLALPWSRRWNLQPLIGAGHSAI